jgi:hypothetical protein
VDFIRLKNKPQSTIRVNFSNRGLAKTIKSSTSLSAETPDKNTIIGISKALSGVKIKKSLPVDFNSIPEFEGIDYVGYVIDKERLDVATGQWIRIDEYRILGSSAANFRDSRIAYGCQYRYRIRSVVKITTPVIKNTLNSLDFQEDIKRLEKNDIKDKLNALKGVLSRIDTVTNQGIASKLSQGKKETVFEVIKGLKITANEKGMSSSRVLTDSPRKTIDNLKRVKNLKVQDIDLTTGTITKGRLQTEINKNLKKFKDQTVEYKSYYYESEPSKSWFYVSVVENEPPPPPSSIKIIPNTPRKEICVTWLKPANSQRDIKYFRLYKRRQVGDSWTFLGQFPENVNFFVDGNIDLNDKWIYVLTCIDAHSIESVLSMQIQAQLNPNYAVEREERRLKWVSGSGALPNEIDVIYKKFLEQESPIIAKQSITISPTNDFGETKKNLIIKVTSLDTHEVKEFKVVLKNLHVKDAYEDQSVYI